MTPHERDRIMQRFLAVWPTPKMTDPTLAVWHEHLEALTYERMQSALGNLERTSTRRPSLADLHGAYDAERSGRQPNAPPPVCGLCEEGWIPSRCASCGCGEEFTNNGAVCPIGYRTVARCPNGCRPLTAEEREAKHQREDDAWRQSPLGLQYDARQRERVASAVDTSRSRVDQDESF